MTLPSPRSAFFLAATLCLVLSACGRDQAAAAATRDAKPGANAPLAATTTVVRASDFSDALTAIGTARAHESVTITAKVSETVQQVHFDSGDSVAKGAVLVTLSGQQQLAALHQAEAAAKESQSMLARQDALAKQQLIASAQLDTQRAARDQANAQVAQVRAQLSDRQIRAPFGGVLGIRQVSPGALVTPGTVIATLDDLSRVYVDFPMPEGQLAQLAAGQRVAGLTAAYPGVRFDGLVSTIDARIDPATRAVNVRADFANADRRLRPGMLVNVELQHGQRMALLLPEISVVQVGERTFVYRVAGDGSVEQVDVKVGTRRDGRAEIIDGLHAGDRVVVDGTGKLRPGAKIADAAATAKPVNAPVAR